MTLQWHHQVLGEILLFWQIYIYIYITPFHQETKKFRKKYWCNKATLRPIRYNLIQGMKFQVDIQIPYLLREWCTMLLSDRLSKRWDRRVTRFHCSLLLWVLLPLLVLALLLLSFLLTLLILLLLIRVLLHWLLLIGGSLVRFLLLLLLLLLGPLLVVAVGGFLWRGILIGFLVGGWASWCTRLTSLLLNKLQGEVDRKYCSWTIYFVPDQLHKESI